MATWSDVREAALALPEVEQATSRGRPSFKVRGKWFAGESPHEPGALVVKCDADEVPLMLATRPDVYWLTPHYEGSAYVLVRVEAVDRRELAERLEDAWLLAGPTRRVAERRR